MTNSFPSGTGVPEPSIPAGAPGLVPRRSSYASVVSGTAPITSANYQQPTRSGAFSHLLNQPHEFGYETNFQQGGGASRRDSRGFDMDGHRNGSSHSGVQGSWGRGGLQLPSFSSAFGPLMNSYNYDGLFPPYTDQFFIPSYLKGSKHMQRLEDAHKSKLAARRDAPSTHSSQPGSLSTSSSSVNLHAKMAPSHRGMTYDLIEKAPPLEEDGLAPLPSRWNTHDKYGGIDVQGEGQEVKFTGSRPSSDRDHEACSIRADHPMPPQCGIYYYEVEIISRKREETSIAIGFSTKDVPLSRPPGWEPESWAYHGDDGHSFCGQSSGKHYGPPFTAGDVIGCGINFLTGSAFFTKNGVNLGTAFREVKGRLFPSIGMKRPGEHIRVNFGQREFVYDIDNIMSQQKQGINQKVQNTSTANLAPPLDETSLIQSLVLQFLSHDGYVETAKAFAEEVHAEREALQVDPDLQLKPDNFIKEDEDAINRQRIRTAILDGDVDKALKYTNAYYPNVLKDNEGIYFRLRIRKFIEMIRQAAEIREGSINGKKSNGHGSDWYDDVINHDMELDDAPVTSNGWDKMDTEGPDDSQMNYNKMLSDTMTYGTVLQAEFRDDPRREVQKALGDTFALLAYEDPINSKEVSHLLKRDGRVAVAEELNSAILVSLGKSSSAALERLIQQTTVILDDLREDGSPGSFVNIDDYMKPSPNSHYL